MMTETTLKLVESLGYICQAEGNESGRKENKLRTLFHESSEGGRSCNEMNSKFPSFSLHHASHLQGDGADSKEKVQMQASALLSSPVVIENCTELERIPQVMLENVYSSFDTLVDTRIQAYAKILGNHSRTLSKSHTDGNYYGTRVLEYKLKTLLEIGTSIYADSVITTFTAGKDSVIKEKNGYTEITSPISMNVEIRDLHMQCADSGNSSCLKVCFEASGKLNGILDSQKTKLHAVDVDVDCDSLLSNMIEEASKVVSMIVDITNEAWTRSNELSDIESVATVPTHPGPTCVLPDLSSSNLEEESPLNANILVENASNIVDFVIGEFNDRIISPPPYKKQRLLESL